MPDRRLSLIEELAVQSRMNYFVRDCGQELLQPRKFIWPQEPVSFPRLADEISTALPEAWQQTFSLFCLASHLLDPAATPLPALSWLESEFSEGNQIFPIPWNNLHEWQWGILPLPVIDRQKRGILRYALLAANASGTKPARIFLPHEFEHSFDLTAQYAVTTAIELVRQDHSDASLVVWPFLRPDAAGHQIEQGSIGLPLFLALTTLSQGRHLPAVLATGSLERDRSLGRVDGLKQKYSLLNKAGCHAFIYPEDSGVDPLRLEPFTHGDRFAVREMQKALLFWNCYRDDAGKALKEFLSRLDEPERLLEILPDISDTILPLPPELCSELQTAIFRMLSENPAAADRSFSVFSEKIERTLLCLDFEPLWARALLAPVSQEIVEKLGEFAPKTGFRLSQLQMDVANRAGQVVPGREWNNLSRHFLEAKSHHDDDSDRDNVLSEIKNFMVSHHNAYRFSVPDVESLLQSISEPLEEIREQFRRKRIRNPNQTDRIIGSCNGLIAQHYAFCGSLDKALAYSNEALDAFGYNTPSPLTADCRQQTIYKTYMHLAGGDIPSARETLCSILGINSFNNLDATICTDPYVHAAIAHYLVESGASLPHYIDWAFEQLCIFRKLTHPWQLWSCNLGKIVSDSPKKYAFLRASLDICSRPDQPTIQVMALMPLTELWRERLLPDLELKYAVQSVQNIVAAGEVDANHFSDILCKNWQDVLEYVGLHCKTLFPFNYS